MADFIVEEIGENTANKTNLQEAVYLGNFREYIISKSHSLRDTLIVADMFSNRDGVDIINSSIKRLIFKDCVKNFEDIICDCGSKSPKLQSKSIFELDKNLNICQKVSRIKIFINGFDENSESVSLDLRLLSDKSEYKYKITNNTIEILIFDDLDPKVTQNLLSSFIYEKKIKKDTALKEVYVIIDEKLIYEAKIEF
ncbi:MAG: DUF5416 family protein [Campylobacter sp.]